MTVTTTTMTPASARALRDAAHTDAKLLSRKPKHELVAIERMELQALGTQRIAGGPVTKDEFIRSILDMRFPRAQQDQANHVLGHKPGERWSACQFCACQVTWTDGDGFLRQCDQPPHDGRMHRDGQAFYSSYAA